MEERVAKLEQQFASIDAKLSRLPIIEAQMAKATEVAEIKGQLSQIPKTTEWGALRAEIAEIKGKISNIPTTWQMMFGLLGVVLAILWKSK